MMAQNCLTPKGPPRFDTVNVPPYKIIFTELLGIKLLLLDPCNYILIPHNFLVSSCSLWPSEPNSSLPLQL